MFLFRNCIRCTQKRDDERFANDPHKRRDAYRVPMASEVTDLTWELAQ
tara:strand:+ start:473 stop:616 length:144 start_codon:yes stop_codon:yes gene_type:complete